MSARFAILISGRGSNMQAIVAACEGGDIDATVALVASDKAGASGLVWAAEHGIKTGVVRPCDHAGRAEADTAMAALIDAHNCSHILLAGYMRILSEGFVQHFNGRALNIHPSLLPKHKGLDTHARALAAGDSHTGATVHFVSPALDSGAAVIQAEVAIAVGDDAGSLAAKILPLEHQLYPIAARWLAEGRLILRPDGAYLDQQPLSEPLRLQGR